MESCVRCKCGFAFEKFGCGEWWSYCIFFNQIGVPATRFMFCKQIGLMRRWCWILWSLRVIKLALTFFPPGYCFGSKMCAPEFVPAVCETKIAPNFNRCFHISKFSNEPDAHQNLPKLFSRPKKKNTIGV